MASGAVISPHAGAAEPRPRPQRVAEHGWPRAEKIESRPRLDEESTLALSERLGEPSALGAMRLAGLHHYQQAAVPLRSDHRWRYTDPRSLLPPRVVLPATLRPAPRPLALPGAEAVVRLDSDAAPSIYLSEDARTKGVDIRPLFDVAAASDGLGTAVTAERGLFEALNAAAWSTGVAVRIPRGCALLEPIQILLPVSSRVSVPRVLVSLEEGADVTLIERHVGGSPGQHVIGASEIFVGAGSTLRYVLSQEWGPGVRGYLAHRLELERDAHALTILHSFGGERAKLDWGASLVGSGAHSELTGFALAEKHQRLDHRTEHRHRASHTWSNMDLKLAVADAARTAATGLIRIAERATESEAYEELRNLLLSPAARADAIPELEIMTNEVHCSHGATSSPVDPEHLFYLRSRGIVQEDAMRMVVRGFFEGALARLPAVVRDSVTERVDERLARLALAPERLPS